MHRRMFLAASAGTLAVMAAGCIGGNDTDSEDVAVLDETLTLATTTSTYDTGILGEVNAAFENRFGASVEAVAQGTAGALETARNGDVDVVLVHARSLEDDFIRDGYGVNRRDLMFNDFVVVGSDDDPAGVGGTNDVTAAFESIAETESIFVSRGDSSGTHEKELELWEASDAEPGGEWYRAVGDGMGVVLYQASQEGAYALTDRGSYRSQRSALDLEILVEGPIEDGPALLANPYGIVAVNPGVHDHVEYDLAMAYIGFLTSIEGQSIIEAYSVDGEQLFFPEALAANPNFEQYVPEEWTTEEG